MPYIYYIKRVKETLKGAYIGQDVGSWDDFNGSRIIQHAKIAYGIEEGKIYGAERLMKENSLSNLFYSIFDDPNNCFGVGEEAFLEFKKYWTHNKPGTIQEKLDFAEMCHILINHLDGAYKSYNVILGGQHSVWTFNQKDLLDKWAAEVDALHLKRGKGGYVDLLKKKPYLKTISIHYPDDIDSGVKLFQPDMYAVARLIATAISEYSVSDSDEWAVFLKKTILDHLDTMGSNLDRSTAEMSLQVERFLEDKVHKELLDWQRVTGLNLTAEITMDFRGDADRIGKFLAKKIKQVINYGINEQLKSMVKKEQLKYLRFSGKQIKDIGFVANDSLAKTGEDTLRIKRGAYLHNVKWTKPADVTSSPLYKWYKEAQKAIQKNKENNKTILNTPELGNMLKKVSYMAFNKWVKAAIADTPQVSWVKQEKGSNGGLTTYSKTLTDFKWFYRGGIASDFLNIEDNQSKDITTLRFKVRERVEAADIHGGLIHYWDSYYRHMITIWLKETRGTKLQQIDKDKYFSPLTGKTYNFIDATWREIEEAQRENINDLLIY